MNDKNQGKDLQDTTLTSQQAPSGASASQTPKKPKFSKKILYLITSFVVVVLLGVATVALLIKLLDNSSKVTGVSQLVAFNDLINTKMIASGSEISKSNGPSLVFDRLKDNVWTGLPEGSDVLSYTITQNTTSSNKNDYDTLTSLMTQLGLGRTQIKGAADAEFASDKTTRQFYSSDEITCNLLNRPEENTNNPDFSTIFYLSVLCANRVDFKKINTEIAPFATAFIADSGTEEDVVFSNVVVQNSGNSDYRNAHLGMLGLGSNKLEKAIFYQSNNSDWRFFTVSDNQANVECSRYDTADIKNAFNGYACWDSSTNSSSSVSIPIDTSLPKQEALVEG